MAIKQLSWQFYLICIGLLSLLLSLESISAQEKDRSSEHLISIGYTHSYIYNEYISILPYKGHQAGLLYDGSRRLKYPKTFQEWRIQAAGGGILNPAKSIRNYNLRIQAHYGIYTSIFNSHGFEIGVGGQIQTDNRILYLPSYGNSSIQLGSNLHLAFSAKFKYNFNINKFPMQIHYNISLPVIGIGFAPDFGASYYEIFYVPGGAKDILSLYSLHNYQNLQNELGLDFIFSKCTLRLSYVGYSLWTTNKSIHQQWHNHGVQLGFLMKIQNQSGRIKKGDVL